MLARVDVCITGEARDIEKSFDTDVVVWNCLNPETQLFDLTAGLVTAEPRGG